MSSSSQYFNDDLSDCNVRPPTLIASPILYGFVGLSNWTVGPVIAGL
jgi:hypothetical protein